MQERLLAAVAAFGLPMAAGCLGTGMTEQADGDADSDVSGDGDADSDVDADSDSDTGTGEDPRPDPDPAAPFALLELFTSEG
jgi:hypothetical protein